MIVNIREVILFVIFVSLSVGSVFLMTATFYVPPMTIYLPFTHQPIQTSGTELGVLFALGAIITLYLLVEERRK